jgi:hypothetical protein
MTFSMHPRRLTSKKLLVASLGVAAVSYASCAAPRTGNLMAPEPPPDAGPSLEPSSPLPTGDNGAPPPAADTQAPGGAALPSKVPQGASKPAESQPKQ